MREKVIKIVSYFMLAVFLAGVAPKEYLHELLYDHEDTVHAPYAKGELVITDKHTHCYFLSFVFAPFIASEKETILFEQAVHFTEHLCSLYHYNYSSGTTVVSLRGPPAVVTLMIV